MRWKQFLTPVATIDTDRGRELIKKSSVEELTVLDVRQPAEYTKGHLPGAKLIPLPQLLDKLDDLDPHKKIIVYWAVGGRSRVAAQMLAGQGFHSVYNLAGGFKAWQGEKAVGPVDSGLELFSGDESVEQTLTTAYSLEQGLREYYLTMADEVQEESARILFEKLASIEVIHQDKILHEYNKATNGTVSRKEFETKIVVKAMEGGLTMEQFFQTHQLDTGSDLEIIGLAMTIEAQALDLYLRGSRSSTNPEVQKTLSWIASEEKSHLTKLGELMENYN